MNITSTAANSSDGDPVNSSLYPDGSQARPAGGEGQPISAWTIVQILAYYAMILLSLIGNTLVIKAVVRNARRMRRQLHHLFIVNLSVADLLFAVENIPMAFTHLIMNGAWKVEGSLGSFLCKFDVFLSLILILTSNLTIMATGVEKFCGTFYPLRTFVSKRRAYMIIASTWLISGIYASPLFSSSFVHFQRSPDGNMRCNLCIECKKVIHWFIFQTVLLATGFAITLILYSAIGMKIWRGTIPGIQLQELQLQVKAKKVKVVKMLAMLVAVFYISFIPFWIYQLSIFLGFFSALGPNYGQIVAFLMYCNGAINPLIYSKYNEGIRDEFKALFTCSKRLIQNRRSFLAFQITRRLPLKGLDVKELCNTRNKDNSCRQRSTPQACLGETNLGFAYEETRL